MNIKIYPLDIRQLILLILVATCLSSCTQKPVRTGEGLLIVTDTFPVGPDGMPLTVLKHKARFYSVNILPDSIFADSFSIINDDGSKMRNFRKWDKYGFFTLKLYQHNDSIYIVDYNFPDATRYWNSKKEKWVTTPTPDNVVFEDADWYVTSFDFGEWGAYTWFRDKHTHAEHVAHAIALSVQHEKGIFYIVSRDVVLALKNPRDLPVADPDARYKAVMRNFMLYGLEKVPFKPMDTLFSIDHHANEISSIHHGFFYDHKLHLILSDETDFPLVAALNEQRELNILHRFDSIYVYGENRYTNLWQNNTLLFCSKKGKRLHPGFMDIEDGTISLHYLNTTFERP